MRASPSNGAARAAPARPRSHDCGVVLCGGGPAGTGVIVCAAQDGRLDELLGHGVFVIEAGESLGAGSIGHYRITGNTPALSFVGWLAAPESRALFEAVATDPATETLRRRGSTYPSLRLVGPYLERLGSALQERLEAHPECDVTLRTSVRRIELLAGGGVRVTAEHDGDPGAFTVTAERAVVAMGGCPPPRLETLGLLPGLTLAGYESKLCHASVLIDDRLALPPHLVEAVRETGSAVVVGGSHSAWAAAWVLLHDRAYRGAGGSPPRVTILHRSPILFFYYTAGQAKAAGYAFDDADICPTSGYVYRYGGLRAPDTRALALAAVRPGRRTPPVRAVHLVDEPGVGKRVLRALDEAGLVVAGVGYSARLPELAWADGRPLEPAVTDTGLVVTPEAQLVAADGTVVPELLVYGLGAGLAAASGLPCEPSYEGRFDAVRLYQNEVGRIALRAILSD